MTDRESESVSAAELQELKEQLAELRRAARVRWRYTLVGGTLLLCTGALTATAQVVTDNLKVFTGGTPAVAQDVNANFALLKLWIERKVGAVSSPDNVSVKTALAAPTVSATTLNTTTLAATGSATVGGSLTTTGSENIGANLTVNGTSNLKNVLTVQDKTLANHIRDYVRDNCSISFGWKDVCTQPASCLPAKSGTMFGNGTCTGSIQGGDASCNDNWFKLNLDGDVNDDDSLFIRFNCK